ncbi:MAG: hypothetical protein ACFFD1_00565 [Candidatus Thorarchaeota archaeon]
MAMKVYQSVWENSTNRTYIFSVLMIFWTLIVELYFIFFPIDDIKNNVFASWLYIDVFGYQVLLDFFHLVIWSICFFFTWILYSAIKESVRMPAASISEYAVFVIIFTFFVTIFTSVLIGIMFIGLTIVEFVYLYVISVQQNKI